jgi:hypothetical protein
MEEYYIARVSLIKYEGEGGRMWTVSLVQNRNQELVLFTPQ